MRFPSSLIKGLVSFLAISALARNNDVEAKGDKKCGASPLPIFDEDGFKSYDGITYASALEGWWKFIDSVDPETSFADAQKNQDNGEIFYLLTTPDGTLHVPREVKYIFANVGRVRTWGSEWVDDPDFVPEVIEGDFLKYILQVPDDLYYQSEELTVLGASILGSIEMTMFTKIRNECYIDGCEVRRCRDYIATSDIFQFEDLNWWGDAPNDFVRSHGFFLLISTDDLGDGLHTIESEGFTKKFNYPYPTTGDRDWTDYYKLCIGNRKNCKEDGKGKGRHLDIGVEKESDRRILKSGNARVVSADYA